MATIATKVLDFDSKGVEFTFQGAEPKLVALSDFSPDIQLHFALYGISQKLGDAYSSAKGVVADAQAMFNATLEQLVAGDWRAARGEGESKPRTTEFVAALARIKSKTVEEMQTAVDAMDEDKRKQLRSNDRVKAVIQVMRAEKAAAKLKKMADAPDAELDDLV